MEELLDEVAEEGSAELESEEHVAETEQSDLEDLGLTAFHNVKRIEHQDRQKRLKRKFVGGRELTEEEMKERSRKIRFRFRLLMRLLVNYRIAPGHDYLYYDKPDKGGEGARVPVFNVNAFKRVQKFVQLPPQVKRIMLKPSEFRTEEEIELVCENISKLALCEKYPRLTQREMARVVTYNFIDEGRTVVKQGQLPINFYFLLSGALVVFIEEKDLKTGEIVSRAVGELKAGDQFGELALVQNIPRTATVTSKLPSEVLVMYRTDFNSLIKSNVQHEWQMRYNCLIALKQFANWPNDQLKNCTNNCKQVKFNADDIIIGNVIKGRPENMYFVTEGRCRVVEVLRVITQKKTAFNKSFKLQLLPVEQSSKEYVTHLDPWSTIARRYIHIMTLDKGQYFGAGEDLCRRYIMAWGKVECIAIPHLFLKRHDHLDWVELLQDNLQIQLPSHQFIFQEFVERASWRAYKQRVFQDTIKYIDKKPQMTTMEDVPLSIRQAEAAENWITIQS